MKSGIFALTACLTLAVVANASAQEGVTEDQSQPPPDSEVRTAKNAVYFELLGPAIIYSLNYERAFSDDVSARIGFSYFSIEANDTQDNSAKASLLMVPVTVSYLGIGSPNHMLELGAGAVLFHASAGVDIGGEESEGSVTSGWGTAIVGYRYQPADGGFMFRAGLSPLVGSGGAQVWPHVSFGGAF